MLLTFLYLPLFLCFSPSLPLLLLRNETRYGIRLEDVVLVTEHGYEILSGELAESSSSP